MNKSVKKIITLIVAVIFVSSIFLFIFSPVVIAKDTTLEIGISGDDKVSGITDYIKTIYSFASGIVAGLAAVMIVIGGIQYATAAGNQKGISQAKETITSAIIGLVIVGAGYLILGAFGTQFTNLTEPTLNINKFPNSSSTPVGDRCPDGYHFYENYNACVVACSPYGQACEETSYSNDAGQNLKGYCCKQGYGTDKDRECMEKAKILHPLGLCNYEGPCWKVMSKSWCDNKGIPHNQVILNYNKYGRTCTVTWGIKTAVWDCTFDTQRCQAEVDVVKNWCEMQGCSREINYRDTVNGTEWFCGPASSSQ